MHPFRSHPVVTLVIAALVVLALGGAGFIWFGVYDVAATEQHTAVTYHLMHTAMKRSVAIRARDVRPPDLRDPHRLQRGLVLFRDHCVQCHGGPGVAPEPFALGMRPAPVNLAQTARDWAPQDIYWVVKHGIKMTGMPGWQFRMTEDELWDVVGFLDVMTKMSPLEYRQKAEQAGGGPSGVRQVRSPAEASRMADGSVADKGNLTTSSIGTSAAGTGAAGSGGSSGGNSTGTSNSTGDAQVATIGQPPAADPPGRNDLPRANAAPAVGPPTAKAGLHAIYQYACVTCHEIPGAVGAHSNVGPTLKGIARRSYIAGVLTNDRDNMVRWLMHPQAVDPRSAMPDLRVTKRDAEDIAAYLATLDH